MKTLFSFLLFLSLFLSSFVLSAQTDSDELDLKELTPNYIRVLKSLTKTIPKDSDLKKNFTDAFEGKNLSTIKDFFQNKTVENKNLPLNFLGLGLACLQLKMIPEAKNNLEKALALSKSKDPEILILSALLLMNSEIKDLNRAIELLNTAQKLNPENAEIYLMLGDIYFEQNNGGLAVSNYEKVVDKKGYITKAYVRIGRIYTNSRNFTESRNAYQNALKVDSLFAPALRESAELYYKFKKYDMAITYYSQYLSLKGRDIYSLSKYAYMLFLNKNYKEVKSVIDEIMLLDSSNAILYRLRAYSSFETKDYPTGLIHIEKFFKNAPENKIIPSDYEYYGKLLLKNDKDSLGIPYLIKAFSYDSSQVDLLGEIAASYFKRKKYKEAILVYEQKNLLNKIPLVQDHFSLGKAYYLDNQWGKADTQFAKVTQLQPASPSGYLWRGRACSSLDPETETGIAKPHYDKLVELTRTDSLKFKKELIEAYCYLGYYYFQKKENSASRQIWLKVKELDPQNQQAKDALKGIK